jgi:hypothetical protein
LRFNSLAPIKATLFSSNWYLPYTVFDFSPRERATSIKPGVEPSGRNAGFAQIQDRKPA